MMFELLLYVIDCLLSLQELLKNPSGSRAGAKQAKAPGHSVDIDKLEAELEQFLSDAYAQNYLAPNLYVPKSQRPKWRFKAKFTFKPAFATSMAL